MSTNSIACSSTMMSCLKLVPEFINLNYSGELINYWIVKAKYIRFFKHISRMKDLGSFGDF